MQGWNDLSYLNHITIAHYNASYGCGKCLKQAFVSSSALHNHKKVCIGLVPRKSTRGSGGKPSRGGGGNGSHGGSTKATSKKDGKAPTADSQGSSAPPALQTSPCCSGRETSHHLQGLKGLLRQKEEEGCEPCQEELQPQGVQGRWPPLG